MGHGAVGKDKEEVYLVVCGYGLVECMLVEAPRLNHKAAHAMAMNTATEFLFGYGEAGLHGCCLGIGTGYDSVNELYGKNRKRFPGKEKRMNMLLSLEPLIYFESITNGDLF